jgi:hypothetical protein
LSQHRDAIVQFHTSRRQHHSQVNCRDAGQGLLDSL